MASSLAVQNLDCGRVVEAITAFIRRVTEPLTAQGVVLSLSGGVDSSLTAALYVHALGKEVLGVLVPADFMPHNDMADA